MFGAEVRFECGKVRRMYLLSSFVLWVDFLYHEKSALYPCIGTMAFWLVGLCSVIYRLLSQFCRRGIFKGGRTLGYLNGTVLGYLNGTVPPWHYKPASQSINGTIIINLIIKCRDVCISTAKQLPVTKIACHYNHHPLTDRVCRL